MPVSASRGGLSGNSFWIAERNGRWFLGTWGGMLYHLHDAQCASAIAVAWLSKNRSKTVSDVDAALKAEFGLVAATDDDFEGG